MNKTIKTLDFVIYWSIILIPFFIAIAPAPASIFMGFLLAAFILKKALKKDFVFSRSSVNWPLLFLFVITCVSLFNSINYRDTLRGGIGRLAYSILVLFALAEEVKDRKHATRIIISMLFGAVLVSIDAIWQVAFGADFIRGYEPVINIGLVRATASFKDSNTLGIFLSALAPMAFGLVLYYFKGVKKLIFSIPCLLIFSGILLTYSRPTLLAIYLILLFFGLVRKEKILIFYLVIVALLSPLLLPKSVKQWAKEVEYNPVRFMCNDDRIAAYRNSMNMIKAHPLIGVGANTYMKNYKKYKESPEYRNVVTQDTMYAHNMYLQMAAEIGLIGFGIFIWLLFGLFKEGAVIYNRSKDLYLKMIALSLIACLIAFLVNGLTESSLYYSRVALIFWYLAGFLLSLKRFYA